MITGADSDEGDGRIAVNGSPAYVHGTNIETATSVELWTGTVGSGTHVATIGAAWDATQSRLATESFEETSLENQSGYVRVVTDGGDATYPVTYYAM